VRQPPFHERILPPQHDPNDPNDPNVLGEERQQQRFLGVQAVFRLVEHD
jgi:hypothetical protein